MELLPEWGIFKSGASYKGYESVTEFNSLGLLTKYRRDFEPLRTRVIVGLDLDYSPGSYQEQRLNIARDALTLKYTGFADEPGTNNDYDYDVTFKGISPYAHVEVSATERLRVTLGARYDDLSYDYETHLTPNSNRPASTYKSYSRLSPKAGATYSITDDVSVYASYNQGFRIPSTGDLFRAGGTATTAPDLKPIKVYSYETGLRGKMGDTVTYNVAGYYMEKKDDIVTFNLAPGNNQRLNAGKTVHKGVEAGIGYQPVKEIGMNGWYPRRKT